jgi:CDP-6-deoxy-D-xylo-4-hexulose-3-dehydrase
MEDKQMDNAKLIRVPYGMTVHGEEEINAVLNVLKTSTQMGKHV